MIWSSLNFLQNKNTLSALIRIASFMRFFLIYTAYIFKIKQEISYYPKCISVCSYGKKNLRTQKRVRNSPGKLAIGVQAIKVSLYVAFPFLSTGLTVYC